MNGLGRGLLRCTCRGTLRTTPCSFERVTRRVSYRLYSVKENPEGSVLASSETKKSSNLPTQYVPKELSSQDVSHLAHEFAIPTSTKSHFAELSSSDIGKSHTLHGWLLIPHRKMSKGLQFLQLRDIKGNVLQLRASNALDPQLTSETPVSVTGFLHQRPESQRRPGLQEYEFEVSHVHPMNGVKMTLPFQPDDALSVKASTRAKYRYLDLRNRHNRNYLELRYRVERTCRNVLDRMEFMQVETPLLFKSTPEGAREFIVPTRQAGQGYALPQSPQQYKQILMASGINRYFQFARCFRDEDLRADRQPEFTQLDLEMSFAGSEDVMGVIETLVKEVWNEICPGSVDHNSPFLRMTYNDAMTRYGIDKPDLRYGMEILDLCPWLDQTFCGFIVREGSSMSIKIRNELVSEAKGDSKEFIQWFSPYSTSWHNFLSRNKGESAEQMASDINQSLGLVQGDIIVVSARPDSFTGGSTALGRARVLLIPHLIELGLLETRPQEFRFLWVTDFPLFSPDLHDKSDPGQEGIAGIRSTHHPFTAPQVADLELLVNDPSRVDPLKVRGQHYDLVVNGVELGGGSVRIHDADLQHYVLKEVLKLPDGRIRDFDHLLEALASGCPPHAGIALGFDRMVAILGGTNSIRDVIAFPKTASGADALVGSPSRIDERILREYHLRHL